MGIPGIITSSATTGMRAPISNPPPDRTFRVQTLSLSIVPEQAESDDETGAELSRRTRNSVSLATRCPTIGDPRD